MNKSVEKTETVGTKSEPAVRVAMPSGDLDAVVGGTTTTTATAAPTEGALKFSTGMECHG